MEKLYLVLLLLVVLYCGASYSQNLDLGVLPNAALLPNALALTTQADSVGNCAQNLVSPYMRKRDNTAPSSIPPALNGYYAHFSVCHSLDGDGDLQYLVNYAIKNESSYDFPDNNCNGLSYKFAVTLVPRYNITGFVTDGSTPVAGANVSLSNVYVITGDDGSYSFTVTNGTYTIAVSAEGFATKSATVVVAGDDVTQDFELVAIWENLALDALLIWSDSVPVELAPSYNYIIEGACTLNPTSTACSCVDYYTFPGGATSDGYYTSSFLIGNATGCLQPAVYVVSAPSSLDIPLNVSVAWATDAYTETQVQFTRETTTFSNAYWRVFSVTAFGNVILNDDVVSEINGKIFSN